MTGRPQRQSGSSSPSSSKSRKSGRNKKKATKSRDYYDPLTNQKVKEGDAAPERYDLMIAEETIQRDIGSVVDLTEKDKEFMLLWNSFIFKEDKVVSYCDDIGPLVLHFARSFGKVILDKDLYGEFLIHLMSLNDFGQIEESADIQRALTIVKSSANNVTNEA